MAAPTFPEHFNLADYYLFDRLDEGHGAKAAVLFGERSYDYAACAERALAFAAFLGGAEARPEERALVVLHDSPAFVWAFFGALAHGLVITMGNPEAPAADLAYLVDYIRPSVIVTTPRVARSLATSLGDAFPSPLVRALVLVPEVETGGDVEGPVSLDDAGIDSGRLASLADALEAGRARLSTYERRPTRRDDLAIFLFTSGSTGKSKAAMHTHRDFAFNTEVYAKGTVGYRAGDVTVSVPRLFFGYATGTNLMFPFAVGATTALFVERPTPESLSRAIERHRPTIVTNVPTMMGKLLDDDDARRAEGRPALDLSSVRFHLSAGEALPHTLLTRFCERFGGEVYDGIGSAEMFHIYCTNRPGDVVAGSLGRVVDGYELRVLATDAEGPGAPPLAPGETGVMWVRGDSVALGYFEDRDKSWATFFGKWCRTGDLFRVDERGYLYFSGRADDLLKVGGVWVAPVEVEECLLSHGSLSMAAVIGAPDEEGLVKPKAFVVPKPEVAATLATALDRARLAEALKEHVRATLSKHKYPRWIVLVDDLPKNDRGKVDKKTLAARDRAGELEAPPLAREEGA